MQIEPIEVAKLSEILWAFSQNTFLQDTLQTSKLNVKQNFN